MSNLDLYEFAFNSVIPSTYCKKIDGKFVSLFEYSNFDELYNMAKTYFKLPTAVIILIYLHVNKIAIGNEDYLMSRIKLNYPDVNKISNKSLYDLSSTDTYNFNSGDMKIIMDKFFELFGDPMMINDFYSNVNWKDISTISLFRDKFVERYQSGNFDAQKIFNDLSGILYGNLISSIPTAYKLPFTPRTMFYLEFGCVHMNDMKIYKGK